MGFIKINEACSSDIETHCSSMFFHGDTMICLTQWTRPDVLSPGCATALPKKEAESSAEDDAEKARWKAQRKAAREQAMKDIEKEKKAKEPKRRRKRRKEKKEL